MNESLDEKLGLQKVISGLYSHTRCVKYQKYMITLGQNENYTKQSRLDQNQRGKNFAMHSEFRYHRENMRHRENSNFRYAQYFSI